MQSEESRIEVGKPSNRLYPLSLVILASGLAAGSLAGVAGEFAFQAIHKEPQYPASVESLSSSERAIARARVRFETKRAVAPVEAAAAYGLLGASLGLVLGLAGGLSGGTARAGMSGAAIGGGLGALAGAGLSLAIVPLFLEISDATTSVPLLLLTHAAIFAAIGAAGAAGLGWAWGIRKVLIRCVLGGLVGAFVGGVASDVINVLSAGITVAFEPVPVTTVPRLVVNLGVAITTAIGAGIAGRKHRPRET